MLEIPDFSMHATTFVHNLLIAHLISLEAILQIIKNRKYINVSRSNKNKLILI